MQQEQGQTHTQKREQYGFFPHADLYSGLQWASRVQMLANRGPETATRVLLDLLPDLASGNAASPPQSSARRRLGFAVQT